MTGLSVQADQHRNEANGMYYALWCWKADYWNLGPGAEIGIYYQKNPERAARGFYDIDKDQLEVKTHMKVDYKGSPVEIKQTNWWVTLFRPYVDQRIQLSDLTVWQAVSIYSAAYNANGTRYLDGSGVPYIADPSKHSYPSTLVVGQSDLFTHFKTEWNQEVLGNDGDGKYLSWTPTAGTGWEYRDTNYAQYEFYIKF